MHKDKKAMNILFNGLDKNMFDNVITYTTSKKYEILSRLYMKELSK